MSVIIQLVRSLLRPLRRAFFAASFIAVILVTDAVGQSIPTQTAGTTAPAQTTPTTLGEKLENLGRVYKNEDNEVLQELWLLGRYHGQYHWSEGSIAEDDSYQTRRMRVGTQARLFKKLTLHAQMVSGTDVNPFYNGFTELWAKWDFSPEFAFSVGQQKNRFTHDRIVSSRYLNYLERNLITNQFNLDYTPSVSAQGIVDKFSYYTGVFTNATGQKMDDAFTQFDSGYSFIASGYYDLGQMFGADNATLAGSYIHSDTNQNATNMNRFENGVSSSLILTRGSGSLVADVTAGFGSDIGNAVGLSLQPGLFLTNTLQLVGRYQLTGSNDDQGLQPQKRYEKPAGLPAGDLYQATYAGLNYYIAKHRLKFMNGVEYSSMGGQDVWTLSSMIRFYFGPHSNGAFPSNKTLSGLFESD